MWSADGYSGWSADGARGWTADGMAGPTLALTGYTVTTPSGSVSVAPQILLTGASLSAHSGTLAVSAIGIVNATLSGATLLGVLGAPPPSLTMALSGRTFTSVAGTFGSSPAALLLGAQLAVLPGTVNGGGAQLLTGASVNLTRGALAVEWSFDLGALSVNSAAGLPSLVITHPDRWADLQGGQMLFGPSVLGVNFGFAPLGGAVIAIDTATLHYSAFNFFALDYSLYVSGKYPNWR